jgi:hypothetical protein
MVIEGRSALADTRRTAPHTLLHENGPVAGLLALLWHDDRALRHAAALALAGGDRENAYRPCYGHFVGSLLRSLLHADIPPDTAQARHLAVAETLRTLLAQNADAIRGMSNMNYSFLSSALYLALFSTCRDGVEAVRRLRVAAAHAELCRLLWTLWLANRTGRLNSQDVDALRQMTGRALAALPPDQIPEFWSMLRHRSLSRRQAVAFALSQFADTRAIPYLADALPGQPSDITEGIILCLGRFGDATALPTLANQLTNRNRQVRRQAQAAIAAIERVLGHQARTLLRPVLAPNGEEPSTLLRALPTVGPADPPEQLLRALPNQE